MWDRVLKWSPLLIPVLSLCQTYILYRQTKVLDKQTQLLETQTNLNLTQVAEKANHSYPRDEIKYLEEQCKKFTSSKCESNDDMLKFAYEVVSARGGKKSCKMTQELAEKINDNRNTVRNYYDGIRIYQKVLPLGELNFPAYGERKTYSSLILALTEANNVLVWGKNHGKPPAGFAAWTTGKYEKLSATQKAICSAIKEEKARRDAPSTTAK